MVELRGKRILVTGGAGFLGRALVEGLRGAGPGEVIVPRYRDCDLVEQSAVRSLYAETQPQVVFHLAARVGGIGANQQNPGRYFYENMMMGANIIHEGWRARVAKIINVGTICAYPKFAAVPFREEALWDGYPEETNAPYGIAKKSLIVMAQGYRQQYGLNAISLLPVNLYGPHDNFDPESSHVIPALIRKFVEAKAQDRDDVVLWGDGTPTREFMYVEDCAEGLLLAAQRFDGPEPVNLGAGFEITIKELAELIARLTGFQGNIRWDTSRPNGQPRRMLDVSRAKELFGFTAKTPFDAGLERTIAWYLDQPRSNP
ncbi:MAG: GDP-L-fucose synthase [Proteobacteria bacterium]|nr:GDP-L-fucose synthase [Pseudomonadota bacterium]